MKVAGPLMRITLVVASVLTMGLAACADDPKGPGAAKPPAKTELVGSYQCYKFVGYYKGSKGTGYYTGSCLAFVNVTNPKRTDSIEVQNFDVTSSYQVSRPDFEPGTLAYDSAAARAVINYSTGRPAEEYDVWLEGRNTLTRRFVPFDYTNDGIIDSLTLTYLKQ